MAHVLIMPRQGNSVESCVIVGWKVKEGDVVTAEDVVCEVETDKATFEVPAGEAGTVLKIVHEAGEDVPVLQPIAVIGAAGEEVQEFGSSGVQEDASTTRRLDDSTNRPSSLVPRFSNDEERMTNDERPQTSSPRARKLAAKNGVAIEEVAGTGPGGRVIARDVEGVPATAAAKAAGVSDGMAGTGIGGRVTVGDVESLNRHSSLVTRHSKDERRKTNDEKITETPIKGIRKFIASRMMESLSTTAQFTLCAAAEATQIQRMRAKFKGNDALKGITLNDLVLFATARVLKAHLALNAHKVGDVVKAFSGVHLGVAVDTPRGLMVPVVRNADALSLLEISAEARRLAEACKTGAISPEELKGSTFTVTNLGAMGVETFTPVLNIPEVAILGVGGLTLRPVMDGDQVRFAQHLSLSLTIDHQVVDGSPAARYLKALKEAIAEYDTWMIEELV